MAKVREFTRNKPNTATTKTTTTTPSNTINNGKVHKVRVNIKNMKKSTSKTNSIERKDQTRSPKTRLCFVKLRRTLNNNTSISNNNNVTLQAQCKENEKINKNEKNLNNKVVQDLGKTSRGRKKALQSNVNKNASEKLLNNKDKNSDENNVTGIIKKMSTRSAKQEDSRENEKSILNLGRRKKTKDNNIVVPLTPKRCVIKLQKTPRELNTKDIMIGPSTSGALPSTPNCTRRCVVQLQKTPDVTKTKADLVEPSTPSSTRECVIRLQRTPISRKNNGNSESVSSTYPSQIPVIDRNKRDNFRKLSLTKSFRKAKENNKSETTNNVNTKQQTVEIIKNNNKEILTTNSLVDQFKVQNGIKHLGKLSLRTTTRRNSRYAEIVNNSDVTQFGPHQNSTICFEPARNSTLLEFGFTKDKPKENKNVCSQNKTTTTEFNDKSSSKDRSSQNLANKSEEIENLLNSLDDEDEILLKSPEKINENEAMTNVNDKEITKEQTISPTKTHKFFNRIKEDKQTHLLKDSHKTKEKSPLKTQEVLKKRRFLTKRSTTAKRDNIYEFLSQSQTSDSDNATKPTDPTADIIKKLIEEGKVRVATNCKGKGKPIFKRKPPRKQMNKVKQTADKKLKQLKKNPQKTTNLKKNEYKDNNDNEDQNFMDDHFDNEELLPDVDYDMENRRHNAINKRPSHSNNKNEQEGTFSRLARTVLINQAGRSDVQRKNASQLLEMVKKFVSTPKNKKMPSPQIGLESDLSPIAMPPPRPTTKASPWRVNEDAYLPRTFNFSRSSGNLPSFSSDFIPATPRKEKPKNSVNIPQQSAIESNHSGITVNRNSVPSISMIQSPLHDAIENVRQPKETSNTKEPSVISSFSSNDSNAENMPPPRPLGENCNENENIFDMKQLPNPRRALNYRSPLKAINILEIVHLPPLTNLNKTPKTKDTTRESIEMFGFEENLGEDSFQAEESIAPTNDSKQTEAKKHTENHPKEDLFGFEDFLSQTEYSSQENVEANTNAQNQTIHDKLQDLRKLKPEENELQISLLREKSGNPLKTLPLFDDDVAKMDGMRQRGIKEMLCSTLINPQPSTSKEALRELSERNLKNANKPRFAEELDISELFKDPEPETTFNENDAHRTYIRPYKRKRRLNKNKVVMFLDSDESGDDDNSGEQRKHHHSHETDTSSEQQAPKKKRHRKEPKEKPELEEFVEEFNEMCKEVDSYELIVEKSI